MKNMKNINIEAALNSFEKEDIYSLLLFVMYKLKDNPDYLALSELCYIIDSESLNKFLRYYGGMTITIPKLQDLRLILKALYVYKAVNLEENDLVSVLKNFASDEFSMEDIKNTYVKLLEVMTNYEFKRQS